MHAPLITEDPAQAREQLAAYNRQLARRDDPEYQVIAAGYAELAAGRPLLNLRECFLTCPLDEKGRPRLAIARADRRTVELVNLSRNRVLFDCRKNSANSGTLRLEVEIPPFEGPRWSRAFRPCPNDPRGRARRDPSRYKGRLLPHSVGSRGVERHPARPAGRSRSVLAALPGRGSMDGAR